MSKQDIKFAVKVLSGVNQGAVAILRDSSGVVIGKSIDCDIVFSGAEVADRHVAIELNGSRIRLTPLAQPVYINGKDVGLHDVVLQPDQLVTIGDVDFIIADPKQPWPSFNTGTKQLVVNKNTTSGYAGRPKSSFLSNPWVWGALAAMLLANVHYLTRDHGGIPGVLGLTKAVDQQISSEVNVEKFPGIYIKRLNNGVVQVEGYVSTPAKKSEVNAQLQKYKEKVISHIYVDSELEAHAERIARSLGESEVSFSTLEHGRLKAVGLTDNRNKWLQIKESIRNDVEGVNSINDGEVRNLEEQFNVLKGQASKEKFAERLSLDMQKGTIIAKGKLTEQEKTRWKEIKDNFLKTSFYPFRFREILRTPDADIKLSIRSVSVGEIPFVVSKEGNKYFNGSHVGSGYYIESINDDHILLKNNNIKFPVYFGQKKEN